MRKSYNPKIRFYVGQSNGCFGEKQWSNKYNTVFGKKTSALARANQIIQSKGQVYIKVTYGQKHFNDGIYKTETELKNAMSVFTEKYLIDFALAN